LNVSGAYGTAHKSGHVRRRKKRGVSEGHVRRDGAVSDWILAIDLS